MSTGLMSCVRQNSPPLELSASSADEPPSSRATTISAATAQRLDDVSSLNTTQKRRRRFLPLRNLFRIFRIGTPDDHSLSSSAYRPASEPEQSDTDNTGGGGSRLSPPDTPIRVVASTTYPNSTSCDSLLYSPQRPHREQRRRQASTGKFDQNSRVPHKPVLHLRKSRESLYRENVDSTDFQRRSISEYLGGDLKNDSLSQSHDSVFSESVTASSMSIGLKAELASVLRKKYHDRSVSSEHNVNEEDDDLGFPRSPNTPKRGELLLSSSVPATSLMKHSHNMSSEGSLSMMSSMGSSELMHSPSSGMGQAKMKMYKTKSESRDDVSDLPAPLNHSAARHKMAVRPKKKAPSRMSRIPTVNEVEPLQIKLDQADSGVSVTSSKSSSLPHGVDAKQSLNQTEIKINKSVTASNQLYINPELSKSYSFETNSPVPVTSEKDKEVNGFFRRLLTRGSIKKKVPDEPSTSTTLNTIVPVSETGVSVDSGKPKVAAKPEKPKSGPAARQRILPREIPGSPRKKSDSDASPTKPTSITVNSSSTEKLTTVSQVARKSVIVLPASTPTSPKKAADCLPPKPAQSRTFEAKPTKTSSKLVFGSGVARVASDYQIKSKETAVLSDTYRRSDEQLFPPKVQSQSTSCIAARSTIAFEPTNSPARKPVEKSRSFRFYSETSTESPLHSTMPSLPDLSFSSTSNQSTDCPNYRELINRFEINDNNLMGPSNQPAKSDPVPTGSRNTVYLTTSYDATVDPELTNKIPSKPSTPANVFKLPAADSTTTGPNITQIEDNIDHIMKFACVTVCKSSVLPTPTPPLSMSKTEPHKTSLSSVTASPPYVKSPTVEDEAKERRFSNENVEITDKPPTSPTKRTAGIVVERRKSVSDEKLKFERKIQERSRHSSIPSTDPSSRKSSLSEGDAIGSPAVVLRKKSMSYGSRPATTVVTATSPFMGGHGDEPELMKVFARRSLKLKDQDDFVVCSAEDEPTKPSADQPPTEVVAAKPSPDVAIASPRTTTSQVPPTSVAVAAKPQAKSLIPIASAPAHATSTSIASRLSGYHGLIAQSTTTTTTNSKSISTALIKPATLITNTLAGSITNNNNNSSSASFVTNASMSIHTNNNNHINLVKNASKGSAEDDVNDNHLVGDETSVSVRKGRATICATARDGGSDEFKGILQRRAEWEKRATQTFK